jgi:hypothetical protein
VVVHAVDLFLSGTERIFSELLGAGIAVVHAFSRVMSSVRLHSIYDRSHQLKAVSHMHIYLLQSDMLTCQPIIGLNGRIQ